MIAAAALLLALPAGGAPHVAGAPWQPPAVATTGDVALEFARPGAPAAFTLRAADERTRSAMGWLPDGDHRPGWLAPRATALWLPEGAWEVRARGADAGWSLEVIPGPGASRAASADAPGVLGLRRGTGGVEVAWAPVAAGVASLPGGAGWALAATGAPSPAVTQTTGDTTPARLEAIAPAPRPPPPPRHAWVRLVMLPLTLLVAATGLTALPALVRRERLGLVPLLLAGALAGGLALGPALAGPATRLLSTGGAVSDPADSVAQLAALHESLTRLASDSRRFSWPEGVDWLAAGPSWLAYLPAVPISAGWGPVAGHDLGVALGYALLAGFTGLLARARGAGPCLSAAAGLLAATAPAVLDEADALSLDRAALWVVPLAALALDRAARGGRAGPLLGGIALLTGLLGQVYYGLLVAVIAPVGAAARAALLPSPDGPRRRLGRLALTGLLAAALAAPVLAALRAGTAGTNVSATSPLTERWAAVTTPLPAVEARAVATAGRRGRGFRQFDLSTARSRVKAAASMSLTVEEVAAPARWLPGGVAAWALLVGALVVARRRREAAITLVEVVALMSLALGPFLWIGDQPGAGLTPWGALAVALPGFDQLKNVDRAALLAATLAPVVLALGAQGLVDRLPARARIPAAVAASLALVVGLGGLRWQEGRPARDGVRVKVARVQTVPALAALAPGAVVSLPYAGPVDVTRSAPVLAAGHVLVNAPPFEVPPRALSPWADDVALLNTLAWLSGDARTSRLTPATDLAPDTRALAAAGVVAVVLHPDGMPGPVAAADAVATLDALLPRAASGPGPLVWRVPPAP